MYAAKPGLHSFKKKKSTARILKERAREDNDGEVFFNDVSHTVKAAETPRLPSHQ